MTHFSKRIAATAAKQLVCQHTASVDAPINRYLPKLCRHAEQKTATAALSPSIKAARIYEPTTNCLEPITGPSQALTYLPGCAEKNCNSLFQHPVA